MNASMKKTMQEKLKVVCMSSIFLLALFCLFIPQAFATSVTFSAPVYGLNGTEDTVTIDIGAGASATSASISLGVCDATTCSGTVPQPFSSTTFPLFLSNSGSNTWTLIKGDESGLTCDTTYTYYVAQVVYSAGPNFSESVPTNPVHTFTIPCQGDPGGQQNPAGGDAGGQQNPASGDAGGQQNGGAVGVLTNPINVGTLTEFIAKILDIVLTLGIPIITLAIIYAGFLFVTAQGNSEKLETAKKTLLYTIIGAAILLGSWILASAIAGTITQLKG
jgi:Type IV secretion system pilin